MVPQNSKSEKSVFARKIEKWIFSEGSVSFDVMYHIDKDIKHEVTKVVFSLKKVFVEGKNKILYIFEKI